MPKPEPKPKTNLGIAAGFGTVAGPTAKFFNHIPKKFLINVWGYQKCWLTGPTAVRARKKKSEEKFIDVKHRNFFSECMGSTAVQILWPFGLTRLGFRWDIIGVFTGTGNEINPFFEVPIGICQIGQESTSPMHCTRKSLQ